MTTSTRIAILATTAVALPVLALAGCGDSGTSAQSTATTAATTATTAGAPNTGKTAAQLFDGAKAAVAAATSVHLVGTPEQAASGSPQGLTMTATRAGSGEGVVNFSGGDIDVRVVSGTTYIKAPAGYWQQAGATADQAAALGATWVTAPASGSEVATFTGFTEMVDMAKTVDPVFGEFGTPTKATGPVVAGTPTIVVRDATGHVLFLPASGALLPVRYQVTTPGKKAVIDYSKWNAPVSVTAPAGAVDLGQLG